MDEKEEIEEIFAKRGIAGQQITKRVKYKGWLIQWNDEIEMYQLFTPEEMEQPAGFRDVEWEAETIGFAKQWIDHY